jgi:hypothetical protein
MANKQIPSIAPIYFTPKDLEDPNLSRLNDHLRQLATLSNIIAGAHGTIPLTVPIDMQDNDLENVGAVSISELTVNDEAPPVASGELGLGSSTAAVATAGAATLPANPVGFLIFNLGGKQIKLPYYNP